MIFCSTQMSKTELMYICEHGNVTPEMIMIHEHEFTEQDENGMTALMYLCRNKNVTPELIMMLQPEFKMIDNMHMTALMHLCSWGHFEVDDNGSIEYKSIHSKNLIPNIDLINALHEEIGMCNIYGCTALMYLCGNIRITPKHILQLHDEICMVDINGFTALHHLADVNSSISESLIDILKDNIGKRSNDGHTALNYLLVNNPKGIKTSVIRALRKERHMLQGDGELAISRYTGTDTNIIELLK